MKTKKEVIEDLKRDIRDQGYPHYKMYNKKDKLVGTMYIKGKMDYGFHIYFIHEPDESNPIAGIDGIVTEMFYDLRNREYWIKRNMKPVMFSVRNVDSIFPSSYGEGREKVFDMLSTEANKGLYEEAMRYLGSMGDERTQMYGRFFHRLITEHSYFELLYKAKIPVRKGMIIMNREGTSPREILGLTKTQWKMYTKYGCSIDSVRNGFNEEADKRAINLLAYVKTLEVEFGIDKIRIFVEREFEYLYGKNPWRIPALRVAKQYNIPEKTLIRYIYFECDVSQGLSTRDAIDQYEDYIRMTVEMGYERFDRYPKFLRTAHDIAARNYRIKLDEEQLKEWDERLEGNKKFESVVGDYKVFPPEKPEDLVREGNVLGHCVGSYVDKVRKGISTILFLRERQDLECPLVTIEVRDKRIVQARGKMNNPPTQDQKQAVKKFAKKFDLAV